MMMPRSAIPCCHHTIQFDIDRRAVLKWYCIVYPVYHPAYCSKLPVISLITFVFPAVLMCLPALSRTIC